MQVMEADPEHPLTASDEPAPPRPAAKVSRPGRKSDHDGGVPFGALLGTIAVVLIALHAICVAMIVDRALAHALTPVAISQAN
jgi:hypothetical protein